MQYNVHLVSGAVQYEQCVCVHRVSGAVQCGQCVCVHRVSGAVQCEQWVSGPWRIVGAGRSDVTCSVRGVAGAV